MQTIKTFVCLSLLLLLAACGSTSDTPPATPQPTERTVPTLPPPPAWTEATTALTLDNIAQARELGRLDPPGTLSTVFYHDFSPDSTRLAGLNNELLLAWDLITGRLVFSIPRQNAVQVYYSSDKTELYTINDEGLTLIYDANAGTVKNSFQGHDSYASLSVYDDDADLLALGGLNGEVKVWETFARQSLVTLQTEGGDVTALAFSPDGESLATATSGGKVQLWDWRNRQALATFTLVEGAYAVRLAFSPDGAQLAAGEYQAISVFSTPDQTLLYDLATGDNGTTDVLMYSPDGRFLVNGGLIPNMLVWDTATGDLVAQLPDVGGDRISAAFSPDGDMMITARLDGAVSLWNIADATQQSIPSGDFDIGADRILYVDWTADGFLLTFFDATGPIYTWGIAP
ncbi:MAG: hypothetical protein H7Y09_11180 [Chitinophagaceae bacterium]|nr:hypothetical protein [Anaerolineae bacterium]